MNKRVKDAKPVNLARQTLLRCARLCPDGGDLNHREVTELRAHPARLMQCNTYGMLGGIPKATKGA